MNTTKNILLVLGVVIITLAGIRMYTSHNTQSPERNTDGEMVIGTLSDEMKENLGESDISEIGQTMTISIPGWELDNSVSFTEYTVPQSPAVLDASYKKLFEVNSRENNSYNGLSYESVMLDNGVAQVFLSGDFRPIGDLSGAYMRGNINQTAFQFDSVSQIEVYVNDQLFDWCVDAQADPFESGCDIAPKLWIDIK